MSLLAHHGLLLQAAGGGGGGSAGAWNPTDVAMSANTFNFTNSDATVDNIGGSTGRGSVRNTTSKTDKRYAEISADSYGNLASLGLVFGFWNASATLRADWSNGSNLNASLSSNGTRSTYGQANIDSSYGTDVAFVTAPEVFGLRIEPGVSAEVNKNNGPWRSFPSFTEASAMVFACMGDGNFGQIGDSFQLTILTTAATQNYAAPSGYTPWDD